MAKPKEYRRVFNLLKPFKAPPNTWDKIYDWLVGRARIIMLFVEIFVVVAFVVKVAVDLDAKYLNETITASDAELKRFGNTIEPTIREIQQKSDTYQRLWEESTYYSPILREVNSYITNPNVDFQIRITAGNVIVQGGTSLSDLSAIEARMKSSTTFTNVRVNSLSVEGDDDASGQGEYILHAEIVNVQDRPRF